MKHKETDSNGSFVALGVAVNYNYDAEQERLEITSATSDTPLLHVQEKRVLSMNPIAFARNIDKASQIYALALSDNQTHDLSEVFEDMKLTSILENSAKLARYCFDLKNRDFERFSNSFCSDFNLKRIKIKKVSHHKPGNSFYVGKLKTQRNNSTRAMASTLHETLKRLSDKAVSDLITSEYLSVNQSVAHDLLGASSNLATLSRILDTRFSPHKRIAQYSHMRVGDLLNAGKKSI